MSVVPKKTLKIYEEVEHKQLGVGCETDVASSSRSIIQNSENNDFMLYQHDQDIDMQETYDISLTDSIEDEAIAEELEAADETNCSIATNMNESLATERGAAKWVKKLKVFKTTIESPIECSVQDSTKYSNALSLTEATSLKIKGTMKMHSVIKAASEDIIK
jgi:hypothetical protein